MRTSVSQSSATPRQDRLELLLVTLIGVALLHPAAPSHAAEEARVTSEAEISSDDRGTRLRVIVTGDIAHPLPAVRRVLRDIDGFREWFPGIGAWQVQTSDADTTTVHGTQPFPWPIRDRDYVVRYRWRDRADGGFELEAVAQANASPPPRRGVIRVEDMRTHWTLQANGDHTTARYEYEGDPGMRLPDWLRRRRWQSHTNAVIESLGMETARRASAEARGMSDRPNE